MKKYRNMYKKDVSDVSRVLALASRSSNVSPVDHQNTKKKGKDNIFKVYTSIVMLLFTHPCVCVCVCENQLEITSPSVTFLFIFLPSEQKRSERGQDLFMMTLNEIHTCFQSMPAVMQPRKQTAKSNKR